MATRSEVDMNRPLKAIDESKAPKAGKRAPRRSAKGRAARLQGAAQTRQTHRTDEREARARYR